MIVTVVAYRQLSFMRNKELGINIDQVVVIKALNFDKETWSNSAGGFVVDSAYQQKLNLFKEALHADATFTNVTSISHLPDNCRTGDPNLRQRPLILKKLIVCSRWVLITIFFQHLK